MEGIINKVAGSGLITIDAADYYPSSDQSRELDIKDWLFHGLILKEADFRASISSYNWEQYADKYLRVFCSNDAIIPKWAYMLIASKLVPYSVKAYYGNEASFMEYVWIENLKNQIKIEDINDMRIVIKGCGDIEVTENVYMYLVNTFQPYVKSLMFGEACSTVPVYKKPKEAIQKLI